MGLTWQIFGTGVVCYFSLIIGYMFSWPSSTIEIFQSKNTTLTRPMSETELSLLGSLSSVGALISTPIFGYILDKMGRRVSMILAGIPYVLAWTLISFGRHVELILTAMFISGIGGAAFLVIPVYISEICQDSIRGSMTSGSILFIGLGTLFSYLGGGYLTYHMNVYIQLCICAVYTIVVYFLWESPSYLLQKGLEEEAVKALAFYRSLEPDSKEVLEELYEMKRILSMDQPSSHHIDSEGTPAEKEKLNVSKFQENIEKINPWKFLIKSKSSRRGLFISLVLITSSIYMGLVIVQVYAQPLFTVVLPKMSPTLCSILFAVICLIATLISAYLVEVAGRKILMMSSAIGSGVCTLLLGTQLHFHWAPDILTAIFIYAFCIAFSLGAGSIPYVLIAELFLPEVKGICSMLAVEWAWLMNFGLLLVYYPLEAAIGIGPVFYIFSGISFITAAFCYFVLPETKGIPVDIIQERLLGIERRKSSL